MNCHSNPLRTIGDGSFEAPRRNCHGHSTREDERLAGNGTGPYPCLRAAGSHLRTSRSQVSPGLLVRYRCHFFLALALLLLDDFGLAADFFFAPLHPHLLHILHPFRKSPPQADAISIFYRRRRGGHFSLNATLPMRRYPASASFVYWPATLITRISSM